MRLKSFDFFIAVDRRFEYYIAEFLLIRVLIILFLSDLIELLFGRVREEQLRLW